MSTDETNPGSRPRTWWQWLTVGIASSPLGARLYARVAHHVDRLVWRLSSGRTTATALLSGLVPVWLTTVGAKSGLPRTVPLLGFEDGERVILIASNWGQARHPAWYHNLRANPRATLQLRGQTRSYHVREATAEERTRYWQQAVVQYPGYTSYESRAGGRPIPMVVLTPADS